MEQQFATQILTLGQLFANPHIVQTPSFQRSFAWTREEASVLLDEIEGAFEAKTQGTDAGGCFLGTMLFIEPEKPAPRLAAWPRPLNPRVFEVIDGLQRLTTLTILFSLLRDLDRHDGQRANQRLLTAITAGKGAKARHRIVLRRHDEPFFQAYVRAPGATVLQPGCETISSSEERIIGVREYLQETASTYNADRRRRLVDFLLDECFVVILSTRGVDRAYRMFTVLNTAGRPLGSNDILKAHLLGDAKSPVMERATAIWDAAESRLGKNFEALFSHIRTTHGRASLNVIPAIKEIALRAGGGQAFVEQILQPSAAICDTIHRSDHSGSPHSSAINASLTYLSWLNGNADWLPLALYWWLQKGDDPAELAWFLGALDRLAYVLHIYGHSNKRRLSRMGAILHALRDGQDLRRPSSPLNLTGEESRMLNYNLRNLHKRQIKMAKFVLLRLNDVLAGEPQNLATDDLTVEHLLPRQPGVNSPWRTSFPDAGERDRYTGSLGNLVLATKAQNDKAGNLEFSRKKDALFGSGPQFPVNEFVRRQTEWKAPQIEEREGELLRCLDRLWQVGPRPRGVKERADGAPTSDSTSSRRFRLRQAAGAP
jgi:hypothetical protein